MSRLQFFDAMEDRPRPGNVEIPKKVVDCLQVHVWDRIEALSEGARGRGECQLAVSPLEEERFFAERVPGEVYRVQRLIENRE